MMEQALRCDLAVPFAALYESRAEAADVVKFVCAGEVEHASEFVCRLHSGVLGTMLQSKFKEGAERTLEVDPRYAAVWPLVIKFFYGLPLVVGDHGGLGSGGSGRFASLCLLYELADYYGISALEDQASNMLAAEKWGQQECLTVFRNPRLRSDRKWLDRALRLLAQAPRALFEDPVFVTLSKETMLEFVRGRRLQCPERHVFEAVLKWQKSQKEAQAEDLEDPQPERPAKQRKQMSEKLREEEKPSEGDDTNIKTPQSSLGASLGCGEKTDSKDSKTEDGPHELLLEEFADAIFFGDMSSTDLRAIRPHLKLETYVFYLEILAGCRDKEGPRGALPAAYLNGVMRCEVCGEEEDASRETQCVKYHPGLVRTSRERRHNGTIACRSHMDNCANCPHCNKSPGWKTLTREYHECCGATVGTSSGCKRRAHKYVERWEELRLREDTDLPKSGDAHLPKSSEVS